MNSVIKEKNVEQTIYIAFDGSEFENKDEAIAWESKLNYEANIKPEMYRYERDDDYYIIRSINDFYTLRSYYLDECMYCFNHAFDETRVRFPILVKYDCDGMITIIYEAEYNHYRKLCEMYESLGDMSENPQIL